MSETAGSQEVDLDQHTEVAADYVEGLLDIAGIDGDLTLDVNRGRPFVSVESDGSGFGKLAEPNVVQALQDLTRLHVQNVTGEFSRVILDIGGSRDQRRVQLGRMLDQAVAQLEGGATTASLPAMSSYERKLVHDLALERGLHSESYGDGSDRHPVISRAS